MNMGLGAIIITLISLLFTFFVFGRNVKDTFNEKFFYWLNSTLVLAPLLFAWFSYCDAAALSPVGALISICLAAAFTLGRAYLIAMLI
jgi:hypothetical protein